MSKKKNQQPAPKIEVAIKNTKTLERVNGGSLREIPTGISIIERR